MAGETGRFVVKCRVRMEMWALDSVLGDIRRGRDMRAALGLTCLLLLIVTPALAADQSTTTKHNAKAVGFENFYVPDSVFDVRLQIFDLKVNYLHLLPRYSYDYLDSIDSMGLSPEKILCTVKVKRSLMKLPLSARKEIMKTLCRDLFTFYQGAFLMVDQPQRSGEVTVAMKPFNLEIQVTVIDGYPKLLATWQCGNLNYTDNFMK